MVRQQGLLKAMLLPHLKLNARVSQIQILKNWDMFKNFVTQYNKQKSSRSNKLYASRKEDRKKKIKITKSLRQVLKYLL